MKILPDTNVLLDHLDYLETMVEDVVVIPYTVIQELDKIKREYNTERGYKARRAVRAIKAKLDTKFFPDSEDISVEDKYNFNNDDWIVHYAHFNNLTLVTGDFNLQLKAKALEVPCIALDEFDNDIAYQGVREYILNPYDETDAQFILDVYENRNIGNPMELLMNEYIVLKDETRPIYGDVQHPNVITDYMSLKDAKHQRSDANYRWNGEELVLLNIPKNAPKPKNAHQACAIDMLASKDIKVKILAGTYGSGKTFISIRMAQWHLDQSDSTVSKIMVIRNPIGSGEEIGFLPGDMSEKIEPFFKPIVDNLDGGEQVVEVMRKFGTLSYEIPFYMKGMSIEKTYMHVEECEDLNKKVLKLIGSRMGDGTFITFAGDYKQAEDKYKYDNGMLQMIEEFKGDPMVGVVVLKADVRSEASKLFANL